MAEGTGGFINPEKILEQLVKRNDLIAADFGCGHGYFSIPLSKMLTEGKVYAFDVQEEALQSVASKAGLEGIENIETIRCNLEKKNASNLDDKSIDLVILANILYQSDEKEEIIKEAIRVLKDNGEMVTVEWIKGAPLSPKGGWLVSREETEELVTKQGLILDRELEINDDKHFGLVFKKKNA